MLLLCAGAASSLAGVWTSAGLSEASALRLAPRVLAAAALGLLVQGALYWSRNLGSRAELSLPLLFGVASVLALAVGAAKVEAALLDKDGPRVVRRAAGIVAGTLLGMVAVGAASLDLGRPAAGWALMFGLVAATFVVFAQRARYAGAGLLGLGRWSFALVLLAGALLVGAGAVCRESGITRGAPHAALPADSAPSLVVAAPSGEPTAAPATGSAQAAPSAAPPAPATSGSAAPALAPSVAVAPEAGAHPGEIQIEAVASRGMLEADARGGVQRRIERLQACLVDPKNQQSGALSVKFGIDPSGSVTYSRATGGDLVGTPLAACLVPVFYKMGFAEPASTGATIEITLRAPSH